MQPPLLVLAKTNAEYVLPIGQDARSLLRLRNSEEQNHPHWRDGLNSHEFAFDHGTTTQAQPRLALKTTVVNGRFPLLRLPHLIDGLNADHDGIAFTGLHEVQH
jgi:hypothetical protein